MKRSIIMFLLVIAICSCKEGSKKQQIEEELPENEKKIENLDALKSTAIISGPFGADFIKWWSYHTNTISLSSDFIGLDENSEKIEKNLFLEKLTSGNFIPIRLKSTGNFEQYKLYKIDSIADKSVISTIKNESLTYLKYYNMEGASFPNFNFIDINGNHFSNENTLGKKVIIKTWFINCVACIAEFPELNELVETYKNDKDIIFLSLALDSKSELVGFLENKKFNYQVVPNQREFILDKLKLQTYPTHIIIDKNGIILKVVNKASEMISFLEKS